MLPTNQNGVDPYYRLENYEGRKHRKTFNYVYTFELLCCAIENLSIMSFTIYHYREDLYKDTERMDIWACVYTSLLLLILSIFTYYEMTFQRLIYEEKRKSFYVFFFHIFDYVQYEGSTYFTRTQVINPTFRTKWSHYLNSFIFLSTLFLFLTVYIWPIPGDVYFFITGEPGLYLVVSAPIFLFLAFVYKVVKDLYNQICCCPC
jgi:hypothetical protein